MPGNSAPACWGRCRAKGVAKGRACMCIAAGPSRRESDPIRNGRLAGNRHRHAPVTSAAEATVRALVSAKAIEALEPRLLLAGNVIINEINYHASSQNVGDEWIELYNKGPTSADLTGWHFGKGVNFAFAPGTSLGAGQYLVVAHDLTRFHANYTS